MGIVHRDIKLENVLYENHSRQATVRLIDFGLSRTFDRTSVAADYARTPYTMSPETAANLSSSKFPGGPGSEVMTAKTDVWAVGVITFIMLSGEFPFIKTNSDLKDHEKMEKLKKVRGRLYMAFILFGCFSCYDDSLTFCRLTSSLGLHGKAVESHQRRKNL